MDRGTDQKPAKGSKPWATPSLRTIRLTQDERDQLEESDDPMALLLKLRPELTRGD